MKIKNNFVAEEPPSPVEETVYMFTHADIKRNEERKQDSIELDKLVRLKSRKPGNAVCSGIFNLICNISEMLMDH